MFIIIEAVGHGRGDEVVLNKLKTCKNYKLII